jgi:hypothetical protein
MSNLEASEARVPPKMLRHLDVGRLNRTPDGKAEQVVPIFPRPTASARHVVQAVNIEIELALSQRTQKLRIGDLFCTFQINGRTVCRLDCL